MSANDQRSPDSSRVPLLSVLPELAAGLPANERAIAARATLGPVLVVEDQDLTDALSSRAVGAFDFLVIEGAVLKQTTLLGRAALEVLGPGDVLAPPLTAVRQVESRAVSRYFGHGRVAVAPLDARFLRATARWPPLAAVLHDRLAQQTHRASMHLAMLHLPRVEERIAALFSDLGERFGHVTPEGIIIDLPLTHATIGGLVGSRRPTVSLAMRTLEDEKRLRRGDDRWIVSRDALAP